jgi:hypothetical protein
LAQGRDGRREALGFHLPRAMMVSDDRQLQNKSAKALKLGHL